jgi:hypothetical protein
MIDVREKFGEMGRYRRKGRDIEKSNEVGLLQALWDRL